MATGSQNLTTYYAKRIIGDTEAATASKALLQTGANITTDTWVLNRTNRDTAYGIKYTYDSTTTKNDKIEFIGGGDGSVQASISLKNGDISVGTITSGTWNGSAIGLSYISGIDTTSGSTTSCLTQKGTWAAFGTSNLTLGTTSTTAAKGNHTHGNVTNDGCITTSATIAADDYIIIGDNSASGKLCKGPTFDASTATKCLTQKGTWATFGTSNLALGSSSTEAATGNHAHGNITNSGCVTTAITIAADDYILIGDNSASGKVGKGPVFDASTATKCLTQKGTWATFGTSNLAIGSTSTDAAAGNHTHGNITNSGCVTTSATIAADDYVLIGDSSASGKVCKGPVFDASTATKCLTQKGTWATFLSSHQDISGKVDKAGDTTSGAIVRSISSKSNIVGFAVENTNTDIAHKVSLYCNSSGTAGLYDNTNSKWLIYSTVGGTVRSNSVVEFTNTTSASSTSTGCVIMSGGLGVAKYIYGARVYGAYWNDYAEYRSAETIEGGYCVTETKEGIMKKATERLQPGCRVTSDTYGFSIGESESAKTPIAVSGRVLVYPYRNPVHYQLGAAVCSAPGGTVDIMSREEIMKYPERIVGTVSEIPDYEVWHGGTTEDPNDIKVNGRIWIYVR